MFSCSEFAISDKAERKKNEKKEKKNTLHACKA